MDSGKYFTVPLDVGWELRFERSKSNPHQVQVSLWEGDNRIAITYESGEGMIKAFEALCEHWRGGSLRVV